MNLSENIKKIRKENNLSQEQLAEKLGVSRQSVSKWESGQAYPEMDKVLQICDLFNLNMDELMKADLKEVRESKQSKANINKYVEDFFAYITKTIDMFTSLKFKDKIKCLLEQFLIACCLLIIGLIFQSLCTEVFRKIFGFINGNLYWALYNIFQAIYLVIIVFISLAIFLHIFKVRYLDYFIFVKEEPKEQKKIVEEVIEVAQNKNDNKVKVELCKKQEKIVIRDPNHSGYKFLDGLIKCALFGVKIVTCFIGLIVIFSLLAFSFALVVPFLFIKARTLFWGTIISILSCIIINLVILKLILNFITSKKTKKNLVGMILATCVIFLGFGGGICALGITNISFTENLSQEELTTQKIELEMKDNLVLNLEQYKNEVEYIESSNQNIIIEVLHSKYLTTHIYEYSDTGIEMITYPDEYQIFDMIKAYIIDLNNYEIRDREVIVTKVYTTKENIEKLKSNNQERFDSEYMHQKEIQNLHNHYEQIIHDYQKVISELNDKINYYEANY